MIIRPATLSEIPRLMEIAQESISAAHWTAKQYESALTDAQPRRVILVIAEDEELPVAGFVAASEVAGEWELENIAVARESQRRGYAEQLLHSLLEELEESQAERIHLEVRESNEPARKLYEKWGFTTIGARPGYYHSPPEDAILYVKNLGGGAPENG